MLEIDPEPAPSVGYVVAIALLCWAVGYFAFALTAEHTAVASNTTATYETLQVERLGTCNFAWQHNNQTNVTSQPVLLGCNLPPPPVEDRRARA